MLSYCSHVWTPSIKDTNWSRLQRAQSSALGISTGCLKMADVIEMHQDKQNRYGLRRPNPRSTSTWRLMRRANSNNNDDDDEGDGVHGDDGDDFQIGAGLYAVGRPVQKRNDEDGQIGTIQSLPLERGALFNRFFGEPAHGPPHVAGGASGPIGGCRDESRTDNPDLDLRHVFDRNNRKTDLI